MKRGSAAFLLSALLAGAPAWAVPGPKDSWSRIETDHFTLYSNAGKRRALAIGEHLERLREVLARTSVGLDQQSPLPTKIFVFKNEAAFKPYKVGEEGADKDIAGYFLRDSDGNYVAVDASANNKPFAVIDHEYMHFVLENNVPNIPLWLNEGLAEFYSTFTVFGGKAEIGRHIESHLRWLQLHPAIPLDALLAVGTDSPEYNEGQRAGTFYAQSWALAHYLMSGEARKNQVVGKLFHLLGQEMDPRQALETAYGKDLNALQQDLVAYMAKGTFSFFRYTPQEFFDEERAAAVPMERKDILYELGDLLARHPPLQHDAIQQHMQEVLALDETHAGAYAILARSSLAQEEFDETLRHCKNALKHDPRNDQALYLQGAAILGKLGNEAMAEALEAGETPEQVVAARELFRKSVEAQPHNVDALLALGRSYLYERDDAAEGLMALERAAEVLPGRADILRDRIVISARSGDRETAERLFRHVLRPRGEPEHVRVAEGVLVATELEEVERLFREGEQEESVRRVQRLIERTEDPQLKSQLIASLQSLTGAVATNSDVDRFNHAMTMASGGDLEGAATLLEQVVAGTGPEDLRQTAAARLTEIRKVAAHNAMIKLYNDAGLQAQAGNLEKAAEMLQQLVDRQPGGELQTRAEEMLKRLRAALR